MNKATRRVTSMTAIAAAAILAVASPAGTIPAQLAESISISTSAATQKNITWNTLTKFSQLKSAINNEVDYIRLKADVTITETLEITAPTTIDLNGYKLNCKSKCNAFINNDTLTITDNSNSQNGKITGGYAGEGGAIYNNGTLYIKAGVIENCEAENGGAIYNAAGSELVISGGTIRNNEASDNGGAVYAAKNSVVEISGTAYIQNNTANQNGGAVSAEKGVTITLENDSKIADNNAGSFGGGIYSEGAKITFDGGSVTDNTAGRKGGGIYENASSTKVTVNSGTLSDNSPQDFTNSDGASYKKGTVTVTFIHNNTRKTVDVKWGSTVKSPDFNGKTYKEWYLNGKKFDLSTAITEDMTLTNDTVDTVYVGSWSELCNALANGGEIVITRNIIANGSTNPTLASGKTASIDLNGYYISGGTSRYNTIRNSGDLTITDSSRNRSGYISNNTNASSDSIIYNTGSLTLNKVTLYTPYSYISNNVAIDNRSNGTVEIDNSIVMGKISNSSNRNSVVVYSGIVMETTGYTISNNKYFYVNYESGIGSFYKTQVVVGGGLNAVDFGDVPASSATENGRNQFLGWYNGDSKYNFTSNVTRDITLTAKWSNTDVRITFNSNGGSKLSSYTMKNGDYIGALPVPTRDGYDFLGWTMDGMYVDNYTRVYNDTTLVAQWEKKQDVYYTVYFESNGGSYIAPQTVKSGSRITYPSEPYRDGYTFIGWTRYSVNDYYDFSSKVTDDFTLTAQWVKNAETYCTVTLRAQGGLYDTMTVKSGDRIGRLPTPQLSGYEFIGWTLNGNYVDSNEIIYTDCTLEAQFIENNTYYEVSFYLTGSDYTPWYTATVKDGEMIGYIPTPDNVGMAGYQFIGWLYGGSYISASTRVYSNMAVYGDWYDLTNDWDDSDSYWDDYGYYGGSYGGAIDAANEDGEYSAENSDEADTSGVDLNNIPVDNSAEVTSTKETNPKTGVEDLTGAAGLSAVFAGLAFLFRKKRS